jgi:hypothetical protein
VAFHDTVDLQAPWQFPKPDGSSTCAGKQLIASSHWATSMVRISWVILLFQPESGILQVYFLQFLPQAMQVFTV